MTTEATNKRPLWLLIEERIRELDPAQLSPDKLESTVHDIAASLDETGYKVSLEAGKMLQLRWALDARIKAEKPLLDDFNRFLSAFELEDVVDTDKATAKLIAEVGEIWPNLKKSERKADIRRIVEKKKLDLMIAKAKTLNEEDGIRYLIAESVPSGTIMESLGVSEEAYGRVQAAVDAERTERERVKDLLEAAADASIEEKIKKLIMSDVEDELIVELAEVDQATVDGAREALKAEMEEKKRREEEEAARKKAEAEGPPLEEIPADQLLEYIESVREIMEFSDKENEIRAMCEQSSIPKSVVDVAVSDPGKLDELEKQAEG